MRRPVFRRHKAQTLVARLFEPFERRTRQPPGASAFRKREREARFRGERQASPMPSAPEIGYGASRGALRRMRLRMRSCLPG